MTFSLLITLFLLLGGFTIHCANSVTETENKNEKLPLTEVKNHNHNEVMKPFSASPALPIGSNQTAVSQARTDDSSNQAAEDFSEDIADPIGQPEENADDQNKDSEEAASQDEEDDEAASQDDEDFEQEENSEATVFHPQEKEVPSTPVSSAAAKQPSNPLNVSRDANSRPKKQRTTRFAFENLALNQPMNNSDADTKNEIEPSLNPYANNNSTVSAPRHPSSIAEGDQSFEEESYSEMDPESILDNDSEFELKTCDDDSDSEFQPRRKKRNSKRLSTLKKQQKEKRTSGTKDQGKKKTRGSKRKRLEDDDAKDPKRKKTSKALNKNPTNLKKSKGPASHDSAFVPPKTINTADITRDIYALRSRSKGTPSGIQMPPENDYHNLLLGENRLNEAVINEYLQLVASSANNVYIFNTSFFPAYAENRYNEEVRRWNNNVDIFSKRLLLFPIRIPLPTGTDHWSLAVAEVPSMRLFYFDSVYSDGYEYLGLLHSYLNSEHFDKKGTYKFFVQWNFPSLIPKQKENKDYDCGVFVLQYAKEIVQYTKTRKNDALETLKFEFEEKNIPKIRKKMFEELQSKEIQFKVQPAPAPLLTTTNTVVDPTSQNVLRLSSGRASQGASPNATSQNVLRLSAGRASQGASSYATSSSGTTRNQEQVTNSVNRVSNVKVRSPDHIIQQPAPVFVQGPRSNTYRNTADFSNQQPHTVTDANPSNKRRHDLVMEDSADETSNIDPTKKKEVIGAPCKRLHKGE